MSAHDPSDEAVPDVLDLDRNDVAGAMRVFAHYRKTRGKVPSDIAEMLFMLQDDPTEYRAAIRAAFPKGSAPSTTRNALTPDSVFSLARNDVPAAVAFYTRVRARDGRVTRETAHALLMLQDDAGPCLDALSKAFPGDFPSDP